MELWELEEDLPWGQNCADPTRRYFIILFVSIRSSSSSWSISSSDDANLLNLFIDPLLQFCHSEFFVVLSRCG